MEFEHYFEIGPYKVYGSHATVGGGQDFGQDFIPTIQNLYPSRTFENCLEWCAGPGFIGYGLYAAGLCNHLTFFEKQDEAIRQLYQTQQVNNTEQFTTIIQGHDIDTLDGAYDLIVSNPPHFNHDVFYLRNHNRELWLDQDWNTHKNFFNNIKKNLAPDGVILLQESAYSSCYEEFDDLVKDTGLKISGNIAPHNKDEKYIYYIELTHA
jgi:tRNA1(Val) A37 N6-methylase TrmN6